MKKFEIPAMRYVVFGAKDILASSAEEPTENPRPDFTTPEDDFDDVPTGK